MNSKKNIVLTGELHCGKSTLVRTVLDKLSIEYQGIFVERIIDHQKTMGYGLRLVGQSGLFVFAHTNFKSSRRFDKFYLDLTPFDRATNYLEKCLQHRSTLFVIDEVGVVEKSALDYERAVMTLFDSDTTALVVVQKRSEFLSKIRNRPDVVLFELKNNVDDLEKEIFSRMKLLTRDC